MHINILIEQRLFINLGTGLLGMNLRSFNLTRLFINAYISVVLESLCSVLIKQSYL
mgnify:CR=1|jgi:hypothetical protein